MYRRKSRSSEECPEVSPRLGTGDSGPEGPAADGFGCSKEGSMKLGSVAIALGTNWGARSASKVPVHREISPGPRSSV